MAKHLAIKSPFARVFTLNNKEVTEEVTYFRYRDSEDEDDYSIIRLSFKDPNFPDVADLQDGKPITIQFGYLGEEDLSKKVTLFIRDSKGSYKASEQILELRCTDKFSVSKQYRRSAVHSGTAEEITQKIGENSGLRVVIEDNVRSTPYDFSKAFIFRPLKNKGEDLIPFKYTKTEWDAYLKTRPSRVDISAARKPFNYKDYVRNYHGDPQANISDQAYLKDLWSREPGDVAVVGRGDSLIVKKRDFSATPKRTYTWASGDGELLEFTPESKNRNPTLTQSYQNTIRTWDEDTQTYKEMLVSSQDNPETRLGNSLPYSDHYRTEMNKQAETLKRSTGKDPRLKIVGLRGYDTDIRAGSRTHAQRDNAYVHVPASISVEKNAAYFTDSMDVTPEETVSRGLSDINGEEMKSNPAEATVEGNPSLSSGDILTIGGIASRWAGNYYIVTIEHEMVPNSFYKSVIKFARNGRNAPGTGSSDLIEHEFKLNRAVGPRDIDKSIIL